MKTWFISIAIIFLFSVPGIILAAPKEPDALDSQPAPSVPGQPTVQIIHTREQQQGNSIVIYQGKSLGTVIGPHLILTHNHFGADLGTSPSEKLTFVDNAGRATRVRVADVKLMVAGNGTLLIRLPNTITLVAARLGDQEMVNQLTAGAWLTVTYWDDAAQRQAAKAFKFIQMANGVATLADPDHTINPGDSGGGVYFEGRLIGNTWSYNATPNGDPLGSFNVALVPQQVASLQVTLK